MLIESVMSGPLDTNAYLVVCEQTKKAIIIDPSFESSKTLFNLVDKHGATVEAIYLTHTHGDHTADIPVVKERYKCPVYVHEVEKPHLKNHDLHGLPVYAELPSVDADGTFVEGDLVMVGNMKMQVLFTPGHSPGCVCFHFKEEGVLFSGDTLFKGTCGNISFKQSSPEKMRESLGRLSKLPDQTKVYPGHGDPTTIREERRWICA